MTDLDAKALAHAHNVARDAFDRGAIVKEIVTKGIEAYLSAAPSINAEMLEALRAAVLWTDEEHDVGEWRERATGLIAKAAASSGLADLLADVGDKESSP